MDNLDLLIALLKNDLNALAKCASTCRFWKAEMQDALFRAWHCRACKSKLLHRRAVRRFNEACFQDGPALVCEVNDEGMGLSGAETMKSFDGSGAFEAFRFTQSRKKTQSAWNRSWHSSQGTTEFVSRISSTAGRANDFWDVVCR